MLVLSRKESEAITIGDEITVRLITSRTGKARIGIDAPRHLRINRIDDTPTEPEPIEDTPAPAAA